MQGGYTPTINIGTQQTVTLSKKMKDSNYTVLILSQKISSDDVFFQSIITSVTATSFICINSRYNGSGTDTIKNTYLVAGY